MTNHEAVKVLKSWVECLTTDCDDDCEHCHIQLDGVNAVIEACDVAITELSQPDTDTISRQAVIKLLQSRYRLYSWDDGAEQKAEVGAVIREINELPPSPSIKPDSDTVSRQQARHEKTCEGCKWEGENYRRDECQLCTRNFPDRYAKR